MSISTPFPMLATLFVLAQNAANVGTETNQYYLIAAITALASVTIYLHRSNQAASKAQADADTLRFNEFVRHHEELITKIDTERTAMTNERLNRIVMLMDMVQNNAVANVKQATAIDGLSALIRERISPLEPKPACKQ